MQIVKSLHASVLHKTFSHQGRHYLALTSMWAFRLTDGKPVLEKDLWISIGDMLGKSELFDAGMPKTRAEFLVHGNCQTPDATPRPAMPVSVDVAGVRKQLMVLGDRKWVKFAGAAVGISDPMPFSSMAVNYANAFGGDGFAPNPIGKGLAIAETDEGPAQWLPNVEHPDRLLGSPAERPQPAAFSRVDIMWPQRLRKAGTYDQKYIETRMPGLPDDIDWLYFNDAAPDQWLDDFFVGDEAFEIVGMNHAHPRLPGRLPGVKGRLFIDRRRGDATEFSEVESKLDTVWLFPNDDLGVVIHRGSTEVAEDDGSEVLRLIVAHESLSQDKRDVAHYEDQLRKRIDPQEGFKYLLNSTPLIPLNCVCGFKQIDEEANFPLELLTKDNMDRFTDNKRREIEEQFKEQTEKAIELAGADGEQLRETLAAIEAAKAAVEPSPEVARMNEIMEKIAPGITTDPEKIDIAKLDLKAMDELREYQQSLADQKKAEMLAEVHAQLDALKQSQDDPMLEDSIRVLEQTLAAAEAPPVLPRFPIMDGVRQMRAQVEQAEGQRALEMRALGATDEQIQASSLEKVLELDKFEAQAKEAEAKALDGYRMGAHYIAEAGSPHPGQEAGIAEQLLADHRAGKSCAGGDYAYADLSGQDLSGIDLAGALLEYVNFSNARLCDANLEGAILVHADLTNTDFTRTNLRNANLGAATLTDTLFDEADLTTANFGKARIRGARFHRCKLLDRLEMFMEAEFERAEFNACEIRKANFLDADLSGCAFTASDLSQTNFIRARLESSSFDSAILASANFIEVQASHARFDGAQMKNCRFVGGSTLVAASFKLSDASECNFRDCDLQEASFKQATLTKSDFGGADLRRADLSQAQANLAQFNKADLGHALCDRINLMEGSLGKARITAARFVDANLYSVNFLGATVGETDFSGAYLEQTVLKDWRPS